MFLSIETFNLNLLPSGWGRPEGNVFRFEKEIFNQTKCTMWYPAKTCYIPGNLLSNFNLYAMVGEQWALNSRVDVGT